MSEEAWIILALLYFTPSLIALHRKVSSYASVIVINVFLGWTFIGWVAALAMAVRTVHRPPVVLPAPPNRE